MFRSPQLKCDLSGLSVNVGESMIIQSSKVRDLGVIFDQFLNFDDHITAICKTYILLLYVKRTDVYLVSQIEAVQVQCMQIIIYVISRQP